jgi:hypothetical protein
MTDQIDTLDEMTRGNVDARLRCAVLMTTDEDTNDIDPHSVRSDVQSMMDADLGSIELDPEPAP